MDNADEQTCVFAMLTKMLTTVTAVYNNNRQTILQVNIFQLFVNTAAWRQNDV